MYRIFNLLINFVLGLSLFLTPTTTMAISAVEPANFAGGCYWSSSTKVAIIPGNVLGVQQIKPTKNRITTVTARGYANTLFDVSMVVQRIVNGTAQSPVASKNFKVASPPPSGDDYNLVISGLNLAVTVGDTYQITIVGNEGQFEWYTAANENCDLAGKSFTSGSTGDMISYLQGYNYTESPSSTNNTVPSASTPTAKSATTTTAPAVLSVPTNFKVRNNGVGQLYFSWDKNKEADLAGYVLYFYEPNKEAELEVVDVNNKDLDNYNISLADHPLLKTGTEYNVKLAAKNVAGAVSQKTSPVIARFPEAEAEINTPVAEERKDLLTNPYLLGGLGFGLILLALLLFFLEKKHHGLKNLLAKLRKSTGSKNN